MTILGINVIDFIAFSTMLFVILLLSIVSLILRQRYKKAILASIQLAADKNLLLNEIAKIKADRELDRDENFIKFLSTSRDWAFDYIEKAQEILTQFDKEVKPIFNWNNTYGAAIGDNVHTEQLKKIYQAYQNLKPLLPDDSETPNN